MIRVAPARSGARSSTLRIPLTQEGPLCRLARDTHLPRPTPRTPLLWAQPVGLDAIVDPVLTTFEI